MNLFYRSYLLGGFTIRPDLVIVPDGLWLLNCALCTGPCVSVDGVQVLACVLVFSVGSMFGLFGGVICM